MAGDATLRDDESPPCRLQLELELREGEVQAGDCHLDVRDPVTADQCAP